MTKRRKSQRQSFSDKYGEQAGLELFIKLKKLAAQARWKDAYKHRLRLAELSRSIP